MTTLKGFTLVEVLVALMVVSLVFLSGYLSLSEMTRNSEHLREKTFAAIIASNLMTEVQLGLIKINTSENDKVIMAERIFYWQVHKELSPLHATEQVRIDIKNNQGNGIYSLTGYINAKANQ